MPNSPRPTRRLFLISAAGTAATSVVSCSGYSGARGQGPVEAAGIASDYSVGSLTVVPSYPMALGRDADGFYAMTLICTHQGCDMSRSGLVNSAGAVCGCHGARFDRNGNVVSGPARSALVHFAVAVDSATGVVTIDTDTVVSSSERAPA